MTNPCDTTQKANPPNSRRAHLARLGAFVLAPGLSTPLVACAAKAAPQTDYVLLSGERINTASFQGKVVLVNFWATSCVTCVAEMPDLTAAYREFAPKGYDMLAVAMAYDPPSYVVNFAQTRQLPFKVAIDNTGSVAKAWGDVKITPTSFLMDKQGQIAKTYVGKPDPAAFRATVAELLKA